MYFKIGKNLDRYELPDSIIYMKSIIIHTYMIVSFIAIAILYEDLKDTSESLEETKGILDYQQKALETHKKVIKIHDDALGIMWDHFANTQT